MRGKVTIQTETVMQVRVIIMTMKFPGTEKGEMGVDDTGVYQLMDIVMEIRTAQIIKGVIAVVVII
jgi:hypothetical protein